MRGKKLEQQRKDSFTKDALLATWTELAARHGATAEGARFRDLIAGLQAWDGVVAEPETIRLVYAHPGPTGER